MTVLLVALGAAVGAPLRYLVDRAVQARHDSVFPWGTLAVNIAGSFMLGCATMAPSRHAPLPLPGRDCPLTAAPLPPMLTPVVGS